MSIESSICFFSLQIFHGVWTIAFFCLNVIESRAILPNASCLLAGYLPATTVLHILLIPNDYPLEFIVTDAVGTFLAIITMFLLLRMECTGKYNSSYSRNRLRGTWYTIVQRIYNDSTNIISFFRDPPRGRGDVGPAGRRPLPPAPPPHDEQPQVVYTQITTNKSLIL